MLAERDELDQRRAMLKDALGVLDKRERRIFEARRLADDPLTLEQLSEEFDVSRERVRQLEVRAFEKVQKAMQKATRRPRPRPHAAHGAGVTGAALSRLLSFGDARAQFSGSAAAESRRRPAVDRQKAEPDQAHARSLAEAEPLAEHRPGEQHSADRNEQRHQDGVGAAGPRDQREEEHIGERGRSERQRERCGNGAALQASRASTADRPRASAAAA